MIDWRLAKIAPVGSPSVDPRTREVRLEVDRLPEVTIRAMIDIGAKRSRPMPGGSFLVYQGTITFRVTDATLLSYTPAENDCLIEQANRHGTALDSTRYYFANVRQVAHGTIAAAYWAADLSTDSPTRRVS